MIDNSVALADIPDYQDDATASYVVRYDNMVKPLDDLLQHYDSFEQQMESIRKLSKAIQAVGLAVESLSDAKANLDNVPSNGRVEITAHLIQENKKAVECAQEALRNTLHNCQVAARDCEIIIPYVERYGSDVSDACRNILKALNQDVYMMVYRSNDGTV